MGVSITWIGISSTNQAKLLFFHAEFEAMTRHDTDYSLSFKNILILLLNKESYVNVYLVQWICEFV